MKQIIFYKTIDNKCPFDTWYESLDKSIRRKIDMRLSRLEESNFGDFKRLSDELIELRFKIGPGYRIYCMEYGDIIVIILSAGDKSTQTKDIKKAENFIKDFKERFLND